MVTKSRHLYSTYRSTSILKEGAAVKSQTPSMLDYARAAQDRMAENLGRSAELTCWLVDSYAATLRRSGGPAVRIVASGSSRHAADCARDFMARTLGEQVCVVTPERFMAFDHDYPENAFNVVVSQSGYSTNVLAALDFLRGRGETTVALTANPRSPVAARADVAVDYGCGLEAVDFVTQGMLTLVEFLMLFSLYGAEAAGTIGQRGLMEGLAAVEDAVAAHGACLPVADAFVERHMGELSRRSPALVVGNGPAWGVAEEAALKFQETLKVAATPFEGEEFMHGPEMQVAPGHLVFIQDDPAGSLRLARCARVMAQVTSSAWLLTGRPAGEPYEVRLPSCVDPLCTAIPNLGFFQVVAATVAQATNSWDVHPFLAAHEGELGSKAPGYDEAVAELERRASTSTDTALP